MQIEKWFKKDDLGKYPSTSTSPVRIWNTKLVVKAPNNAM